MPNSPEKILIVRLAALGDIATTSTLLSRIARDMPNAHVTWVVGKTGAPLVRAFSAVDRVIEVDETKLLRGSLPARVWAILGLWRKLIGQRFSLAVIAHADPRYRWIVPTLSRSRVRMFSGVISGTVSATQDRFVGDETARLLDEPGAVPSQESWEMADVRAAVRSTPLSEAARAATAGARIDVVLVPGGARNVLRDNPLRRWPVERYADVARTLAAEGYRVALVGDRSDDWVRPAFDGIVVVDLIGRLNLTDTLRLMSEARLVLTHDTGPLHFARLVRAPIVALFGPTAPVQMIGNPPDVTVLWGGAHLACRPCYDGRDFPPCARNACMEDISTDQVLRAVRTRLLSARPPAAITTA